jgi:hypothetical protein
MAHNNGLQKLQNFSPSGLLVRIRRCEGQEIRPAMLPFVSAPQQSLYVPILRGCLPLRDVSGCHDEVTASSLCERVELGDILQFDPRAQRGRSRAIVVMWGSSAAAEEERSSYSCKNENFVLMGRCILIIVLVTFTRGRQVIPCHAGVYRKFTLAGKLTYLNVMAVMKTSILKPPSYN